LSTQESAAPKRRSSAANRRRSSQSRTRRAPETQVAESQVQASKASVAEEAPKRADGARDAQAQAQASRERHQARAEARQQAKAKAAETPVKRRFINTDRFEGLQRFYRETAAEIKKVNWPDQQTTRNLTLVVIGLSVVLGVLLGGIDYVLFQLFEALP
jgi:preprotein translocase subunit SecE